MYLPPPWMLEVVLFISSFVCRITRKVIWIWQKRRSDLAQPRCD